MSPWWGGRAKKNNSVSCFPTKKCLKPTNVYGQVRTPSLLQWLWLLFVRRNFETRHRRLFSVVIMENWRTYCFCLTLMESCLCLIHNKTWLYAKFSFIEPHSQVLAFWTSPFLPFWSQKWKLVVETCKSKGVLLYHLFYSVCDLNVQAETSGSVKLVIWSKDVSGWRNGLTRWRQISVICVKSAGVRGHV